MVNTAQLSHLQTHMFERTRDAKHVISRFSSCLLRRVLSLSFLTLPVLGKDDERVQ